MQQTKKDRVLRGIAGLGLMSLAIGCVAPSEHRRSIEQYDDEISALRDQLIGEKGLNRDLTNQVASLTDSLQFANDEAIMNGVNGAGGDSSAALLSASAPQNSLLDELDLGIDFAELEDLGIDVSSRAGVSVITLPSEITFGSGSATLSGQGRTAVDAVGALLMREYPSGTFSIEGHTDSDPISKAKFASNRDLSLARAMAVLLQLVDGPASVSDSQCGVVGWGPHKSLVGNDSKANKAKNRRVEIVVKQ